jgi:hypothetical protein
VPPGMSWRAAAITASAFGAWPVVAPGWQYAIWPAWPAAMAVAVGLGILLPIPRHRRLGLEVAMGAVAGFVIVTGWAFAAFVVLDPLGP